MASLQPFLSTTLEGAFLEAAFLLQRSELNWHFAGKDKSQDPTKSQVDDTLSLKYINITIDTDQQRATITAQIPVGINSNSFGGYLIAYQWIKDEYVYNFDSFPIKDKFYDKEASSAA